MRQGGCQYQYNSNKRFKHWRPRLHRRQVKEETLQPTHILRLVDIAAVSYTHLTLPTNRAVLISVAAVSLKKKTKRNQIYINNIITHNNKQYIRHTTTIQ